jgi:hypothetical protein
VIVNHTFAERFWGSAAKALGKRIAVGDATWRTIVGVVGDVKYIRVNESPRPYVYLPFLQSYRPHMVLHTRGVAPIDVLVKEARAHVTALDRDLRVLYARRLADAMNGALILLNLAAKMLLMFGAAGMVLAAMGTYGLVSYIVRQNTHEIGIRMALGATGVRIVRSVVARGLRLAGVGIVLGIAGALAGARLLGNLLFGVSATDTVSFGRALAIVLGAVIAATIVPAWRAARIDPLRALRHQ